ncbi:unnamed protein product, partial [Oikopleura dioica]
MPWLDVEKIKSTSFVTITRTKFVKEQLVDTFTVQENENKRVRPLAYSNSANDLNSHHKRSSTSISTNYSDHQLSYSYHQILDESSKTRKENELLKRRIEELQKKCADLSTVNEMLLEQNAKYRHVLNSNQPPQAPVPMEAP